MHQHPEKLLQDMEKGRIDRRQLLKALGLSTGAAFATLALPGVATAWSQAASRPQGGKSFPVTTMNHLSYACGSDYVRIRDWYVDLFGMTISWDNGKQCAVEFGDPARPEGLYIRPASGGAKPTIGHFAFGIPDIMTHIHDMKVEMERWGLKNIRPDGEHGWISDDPAGYMLNTWVPEKDTAMFPGAASPCKVAASPECKAAYEAGRKNLEALPKPSGRGFKARYFSNVVLNVAPEDVAKERDFYRDLLGMKVIYDTPRRVFLRFGGNTLFLEGAAAAGAKPYCNRFGFEIENFDRAKVEAELKRRGLSPQPNSKLAWTVKDPDGMTIDVAAPGFAEHLASACKGSGETCPSGTAE